MLRPRLTCYWFSLSEPTGDHHVSSSDSTLVAFSVFCLSGLFISPIFMYLSLFAFLSMKEEAIPYLPDLILVCLSIVLNNQEDMITDH